MCLYLFLFVVLIAYIIKLYMLFIDLFYIACCVYASVIILPADIVPYGYHQLAIISVAVVPVE